MFDLNDALAGARAWAQSIQNAFDETQRHAAEEYEEREATRRTADASVATSESLTQVIAAVNASLEVARNAKAGADRTQRLSTTIAVASLGVAVGSLVVAIGALVVTEDL